MAKRSKYQQKIIKNYYDNREAIALQRAQELVTELYLSEGKKRTKHWQTLANNLETLGIKQPAIDKLIASDDPAAAAAMLKNMV